MSESRSEREQQSAETGIVVSQGRLDKKQTSPSSPGSELNESTSPLFICQHSLYRRHPCSDFGLTCRLPVDQFHGIWNLDNGGTYILEKEEGGSSYKLTTAIKVGYGEEGGW